LILYRRAAGIPWSDFQVDPRQLLALISRLRPARLRSKATDAPGRA
jgi:hypothetical protein